MGESTLEQVDPFLRWIEENTDVVDGPVKANFYDEG